MLPKKYLSEAEKRKRKRREDQFIQSQKGAIHKFFFKIKGVASDFAGFFDVSAWDSRVCYGCKLLSKCFGCLSNPLKYTCDCSFI
jgi:hypothetical protein